MIRFDLLIDLYALGNKDYVSIQKNLTFAVGLGTKECVHIPILNDVCVEDTEAFSASISSAVECVMVDLSANSVEITIIDDDGENYNIL